MIGRTVAALAVGGAFITQGCARTVGHPTRYRMTLSDNAEGHRCYVACRGARLRQGDRAFLSCIESCPGMERTENAECRGYDASYGGRVRSHHDETSVCVTAGAHREVRLLASVLAGAGLCLGLLVVTSCANSGTCFGRATARP